MKNRALHMFVVYDSPRDVPGFIVVRPQTVEETPLPAPFAYLFRSLREARQWLTRQGLVCLPRHPLDNPVIVETWL